MNKNKIVLALYIATAASTANANALIGDWIVATVTTGNVSGFPAESPAQPIVSQTTPVNSFNISAGTQRTTSTAPIGSNDLGFGSAQSNASTGAYVLQSQAGEGGRFTQDVGFGAANVNQTTTLTNNSGTAQNVSARVKIDPGMVARIAAPLTYANTALFDQRLDLSSVSWLLKVNGSIVAATNVGLYSKSGALSYPVANGVANTFDILGTSSRINAGGLLPVIGTTTSVRYNVFSWEEQILNIDLGRLDVGANIISVEARVQTSNGSSFISDGTSSQSIGFGNNVITNYAFFSDPITFGRASTPLIEFTTTSVIGSSSGGVTVPVPTALALLTTGLLALGLMRRRA